MLRTLRDEPSTSSPPSPTTPPARPGGCRRNRAGSSRRSGWASWPGAAARRARSSGLPVPGNANAIVLLPPVALESRIACRSEPGPLSPVFVTRQADSRSRSSIASSRGLRREALAGMPPADRDLGGVASREQDLGFTVRIGRVARSRMHSRPFRSVIGRCGRRPGRPGVGMRIGSGPRRSGLSAGSLRISLRRAGSGTCRSALSSSSRARAR